MSSKISIAFAILFFILCVVFLTKCVSASPEKTQQWIMLAIFSECAVLISLANWLRLTEPRENTEESELGSLTAPSGPVGIYKVTPGGDEPAVVPNYETAITTDEPSMVPNYGTAIV